MRPHAQLNKLLRYGLAAAVLLACSVLAGSRTANAQTLTVDYSFGDLATGATTQAILPNSTYTVEIWMVVTPPSSTSDSNLGLTLAYFGAKSGTNSTQAILGGTASSTGGNAGVGVSTVTPGSIFSTSANDSLNNGAGASTSAAIGDWNDDGVNDLSSTTNKNSSLAIGTTSGNPIYGGTTSSTSEASGATGWAFEVGSFTVTTGATIGVAGSTTTFTPTAPTYNGSGEVDYTVNGGSSFVTANGNRITPGQAVTFDVAAASGGNTSVLALSPSTDKIGILQNATSAPALGNLTLQETSGSSLANYTGATVGSFSVAPNTVTNGSSSGTGASGTVAASGSLTLPVTYTGSTSADGSFTGSYTVTNTSGSTAPQGNLGSNFTVSVGNATDDVSGTGSFSGSVLQANVAASGSYAGLASQSNSGAKAANGSSLPGIEGGSAQILAGLNNQSTAATVSMTWRSRMLDEAPSNDASAAGNSATFTKNGSPTSPPLPGGNYPLGLISDVVDLYGMAATAGGITAAPSGTTTGTVVPAQTDPFAFEMSFNPATLNAEGVSGNAMASHGNLFLASLVPLTNATTISSGGTANWVNTIVADFSVSGGTTTKYGPVGGSQFTIQIGSAAQTVMDTNTGGGTDGTRDAATGTFDFPLLESFATFETNNSGFSSTSIANYLGVWGVDPTNDEAWAIINHNSEFAVVPEPSTILLAAFGLAGAALLVSKRKKLAAA